MNRKCSRSLSRALTFLRESAARSSANRDGVRLAPLRALASRAGVAPNTMLKAVRILCREGILTASPGAGIHAYAKVRASDRCDTGQKAFSAPLWKRVALLIERRLAHGAGDLPSVKVLCTTYGTNYRTVRRALEYLAGRGVLRVHGRGYRAVFSKRRLGYGSVIHICLGTGHGSLLPLTPRHYEYLASLERECSQAGLALHRVVISHAMTPSAAFTHVERQVRETVSTSAVVGFVVWTMGLRRYGIGRVLAGLRAFRRPIAVLEEAGGFLQEELPPGDAVLFCAAEGTEGPRRLGQYLLSMGHRRLLYFSESPASQWSRQRLQGLREAYAACGLDGAVTDMTAGATVEVRSMFDDPAVNASIDDMLLRLQGGDPANRNLNMLFNRLVTDFQRILWSKAVGEALEPFMRRGLDAADARLWVGANDETALCCLRFLRANNRDVPRQVAVAGFDDTAEALEAGLTTYNFAASSLSAAMVRYILGDSAFPAEAIRTRRMEVEGYLVERRTVSALTDR